MLIAVVAFEQRTHGQEIFHGDVVLARIGVGQGLEFREVGQHFRVHAQQLAFDRHAHQHARNGFSGRPRVAQTFGAILVEVVFVNQLAMLRHHDAGDLFELPRIDGGSHRIQRLCMDAAI